MIFNNEADKQYVEIVQDIIENGVYDTNPRPVYVSDKMPAYRKQVLNKQMSFDYGENKDELPMLTQKRVAQKDPIKELFWIWKQKSNVVQDLKDVGCKVWNEWELSDGTIGHAYGWQLANKFRKVPVNDKLIELVLEGKILTRLNLNTEQEKRSFVENTKKHVDTFILDQVDYLIYSLITNPDSTRIKTTLWSVEDLDDMALEPCVYETHWQYLDGELHLTVNIRSNDICLGNSYNVVQYSVLHHMIAQVTGHKVGTIHFNIDNAHIYCRHIQDVKEQIKRPTHKAPKIVLNKDIKSFYDFKLDDIEIVGYEHEPAIRYEVAE